VHGDIHECNYDAIYKCGQLADFLKNARNLIPNPANCAVGDAKAIGRRSSVRSNEQNGIWRAEFESGFSEGDMSRGGGKLYKAENCLRKE
jgi:hypothetical protein